MTKENMAYYISIVNSSKKYIDIKTRIKEDGYPVDMAFSNENLRYIIDNLSVDYFKIRAMSTF